MIIAIDARPLVTRQVSGAEQRARNILAAWAAASRKNATAARHTFQLIFARPDEDNLFDDSAIQNLPPNFTAVEIGRFALPSRFPTASRVLNALARSLNRVKADVYHAFTPVVPRTRLCPVVPTLHDLSFELDPVVRRTREGRLLRRLTASAVRYADRFIAVSSQTRSDAAAIYKLPADKIDIVYNGIDPIFTPVDGLLSRAPVHAEHNIVGPYVLAVGADIPRRNYARMLTAMRRVWSTTDMRPLWILAGRDDWQLSDLYAAAKGANVLDKMRFVPGPTNAQLVDLYRSATITCCASSFEGFGLSVLESMACGTAVCCSDMRSLREVAADAAVYFPHDDAEVMGQTIAGLLEDAEYRRQLKYRGLHRASLFTWATAADLTLESLAAATRPPDPPAPAPSAGPVSPAPPDESPASQTSR
jgi:glycosyltransferase involved in cell wall biosynthesis